MEDYFEIGKIVNTHGVKGEVRVVPTTDDPTRFELLKILHVYLKNEVREIKIDKVWYHKNFVVLKLDGVDDMTQAERYKGAIIKIPPELALKLGEFEFYIRDLLGMQVYTQQEEFLGTLEDIIETGANDVYVVRNLAEKAKELLIPAIKKCIIDVDVAKKKMVVELLKGLRD